VQESLTQLVAQVVEGGAHKRTFGKEITYNLPIERSGDFAGEGRAVQTVGC